MGHLAAKSLLLILEICYSTYRFVFLYVISKCKYWSPTMRKVYYSGVHVLLVMQLQYRQVLFYAISFYALLL